MEISHVEMDHINGINNRSRVYAPDGFGAHTAEGSTNGAGDKHGDYFEANELRLSLRELCKGGQAENYVQDIINSGIEPDCLRAELAFRAAMDEKIAVSVLINYLAGNFKEALQKTWQLPDDTKFSKLAEFLFYSDYLTGKFERALGEAREFGDILYPSPLFCYAYADMLLNMGYIEDARTFNKRYVVLAKKYLPGFVSEKEKFDEEKKRREQGKRRSKQENSSGSNHNEPNDTLKVVEKNDNESVVNNKLNTSVLLELFGRRKVLIEALKSHNVSYDKRPLMFELEDIDARIAVMTGGKPK